MPSPMLAVRKYYLEAGTPPSLWLELLSARQMPMGRQCHGEFAQLCPPAPPRSVVLV